MASTIDNILTTLRTAHPVSPEAINFGLTDNLSVPRVHVLDYSHTYDYQTGGVASSIRNATFRVFVVDKSQSSAEEIAQQIDDLLNCQTTATPQTIGCFQESYEVGQLDIGTNTALYLFGVNMTYSLQEDPSKT